jgi:2-C-methyl-D-erythritol 4-phosphate cytidylyltransferase
MGGVQKTFLELRGVPVLLRALRPFFARRDVVAVVVALAPPDAAEPPDWLAGADPRLRLVAGGDTRTDSVRAGLAALPASVGVVLIHDGARPLVTGAVIDECVAAAGRGWGAVAGFPAVDTMKETDDHGRIVRTPDRSRLWHAQTPQAFPRWMADEAYARDSEGLATDDASLVEGAGHPVVMVEAGPWNLKVTRPEDVDFADLILDRRNR